MTKFKVGDSVKIARSDEKKWCWGSKWEKMYDTLGKIGIVKTVLNFEECQQYQVLVEGRDISLRYPESCLEFANPKMNKKVENMIKFEDLKVGMRVKLKNYKDCEKPSCYNFQPFDCAMKRIQSEKIVTVCRLDERDKSFGIEEGLGWFCVEWIDKIWECAKDAKVENNENIEKVETMTKFKIGDSVKIVKKIEELVGWAEKMDDYLQKVGKITRIHDEGYISVTFEDSEWWNYNPESLELVNSDNVQKCEDLKVGDIVRFPSEEEYKEFFQNKKITGWTGSELLEELEKFYGTNVEISERSGSSDNAKCWRVKEISGRRFPEFIFQKVDNVQSREPENNEQVETSDINANIETLKKKLLSLESKLFKECQYLKKPLRINEYEFLEREVLMLNEIPIIRVCQQPGGIQENFKEVEKFCNDYKDLTQTVKNLVKREKEKILKCIQKCEELEKL